MTRLKLGLLGLGLALAQTATANMIVNGNFEAGPLNDTPSGWTHVGAATRKVLVRTGVQSGFSYTAPQGSNYAHFRGSTNAANASTTQSGLSQIITGFTVGDTYDLVFQFASAGSRPNAFWATIAGQTFYPMASLDGLNYVSSAGWILEHFQFTATAPTETLLFMGRSFSGSTFGVDSVYVGNLNGVPASGTLSLVMLGLGLLGVSGGAATRFMG